MAKTSTWKSVEAAVGALFGGKRVPITGRTRGSEPDIKVSDGIFSCLSFEVKHRKMFPEWLHDAFRQAVASIRGRQFAIVLLHQERKKYEDSYVMMQVKDFIEYSSMISAKPEREKSYFKVVNNETCGITRYITSDNPDETVEEISKVEFEDNSSTN